MFSDESKSDAATLLLGADTILQSRYQVVRHLGKGGMGAVYEAIDLRLGHTVALKQTLTSDPQMWKQFEREARLMAGLNHFVLPRVSDYFTEGNRAFLVMQFVEGADLAEMIAQQPGPFPRNAVVAWADQLLDALIYLHAHERQIIHRDIKPHNLKITPEGHIVLLDFGLAKSQSHNSDSGISCTSVYGYTPRYAPLEQIQDLGTSPQSDIYALGATLYHLLTGIKPPDALARAAALVSARPNPLKPANEVNSVVGPELAGILDCAMAQNPDERYASAGEFREALRRVGRIDETTSTSVTPDHYDDYTFVAVPGEIEVSIHPISSNQRLGPRALASLFIILISAFGVFCNYYPWRMPPTAAQEQVKAIAGETGDTPIVEEKSPRTKPRRQVRNTAD
ncbi:MAG TPA: serine/threonine-protein kinase [Pyrinomonadaceae bacterium]